MAGPNFTRDERPTMSPKLDEHEHLDQELAVEPFLLPATGSLALHGTLAAAILLYAGLAGLFHKATWGDAGSGSSMQVHLVSNALPLPADQPPNKNVLAADNPSEAPAAPDTKTQKNVDDKAIPIADKMAEKKSAEKNFQHVDPNETRAQFGQQSGSQIARSTQLQNATSGPVSITEGNFGARFGYYVGIINRKMSSNWQQQEVDAHTPRGSRVYIFFTVRRDGSLTDIRMDRTSGSPTLDRSCLHAAQRVDTFGPLPSEWDKSTILASYYCEYSGNSN